MAVISCALIILILCKGWKVGAYIIVCADVPDDALKKFDNWYETKNLA